jgi:hypothetical protein
MPRPLTSSGLLTGDFSLLRVPKFAPVDPEHRVPRGCSVNPSRKLTILILVNVAL